MKWLYSIIAITVLLLVFEPAPIAEKTLHAAGTDIITAHRGSSANAPENSVSAIRQAIADHAGYAEIDVRMTADGIVVLSHDDSLFRTARARILISESTYKEIAEFDIGKTFHRNFIGEKIPTLEQIIDIAAGHIQLNIEIKMDPYVRALPIKVASIITAKGCVDSCLVTSFQSSALHYIKKTNPDIRTGLIIGTTHRLTSDVFTNERYDILSIRGSLITPQIVKKAHKHDKKIFAWTINSVRDMRRMSQLGVDSIITDKPRLLYHVLF